MGLFARNNVGPLRWLVFVAATVIGGGAFAQTLDTWTATTSGTWSTPGNWNNGAPASDPALRLTFNAPAGVTYTATNDIGPLTLNTLAFSTAATGSATIAGTNALTFTGAGSGISLTGNGSATVNSPIVYATGSAVTNSGTGTLSLGSQTFANNTTITNSSTGTLTLQDAVTYVGNNVTVNLANTGGGTFNIGNFGAVSGTLNITTGAVTFAGSTSGDLLGGNLVLNISAGASFNFAGNGETMGGISGAGNIIQGSASITLTLAGDRVYTGKISGSGGLGQAVNSVLTLGGANTYTGATTISAGGTIRASAANVFSSSSPITVTPLAGTLDLGGFNQTVGGLSGEIAADTLSIGAATLTIKNSGTTTRIFNAGLTGTGKLVSTGTGIQMLLGNNTYSGTTTITTGTIRLNADNLPTGAGLTIAAAGTLDGIFATDAAWTAPLNAAGVFIKEGPGKLTFTAANAGSGLSALTVNGGGIVLDYSINNSMKLGTNPVLTLGSASISVFGNSLAGTTQNFSSLTLQGGGRLNVTSGAAQTAAMNIGTVTRVASTGATIDFGLTDPTGGTSSITSTTANGATGILGGHATVNGTDWAVTGASGGAVTALPPGSYTSNVWSSGNHTDVTSNSSASGATTSDLRFNALGAATVTLTGANVITDGGILVTPNVGAATSTIAGGTGLTAPANQDLFLHQYNTNGPLTVSAVIGNTPGTAVTSSGTIAATSATQTLTVTSTAGLYPGMLVTAGTNIPAGANAHVVSVNSGTSVTIAYSATPTVAATAVTITFTPGTNVVKSGPGVVNLTGTNTFSGMLILNEGKVVAGTINNLGASANGASSVFFNGGTLELTAGMNIAVGVQPWFIGLAGGTVQTDGTAAIVRSGNTFFGSGTVTKTGSGTIVFGSNDSTFSGQSIISGGALIFNSNRFTSAGNVTVTSGGQFQIGDDGVASWNLAAGSIVSLTGTGPANSTPGAFALTDQNTTSTGPTATFNNAIYLMADSSIGVHNGPSGHSSALIFAAPISGPGALTKIGNGSLTLNSADNSYAGATNVSAGLLLVNGVTSGGGSYAVAAGATLGGSGSIGSAVTLTGASTASLANLAPGSNAIGKLEITSGGVTFAANSSLTAEIGAASSSDLLKIDAGNLSFDPGNTAVLSLVSKTGAFDGSTYVLANYTGALTGAFGNIILNGASLGPVTSFAVNGQTYELQYNVPDAVSGSDITLSVAVPEPTMMTGLGVIVVALSTRRRRRQEKIVQMSSPQ